MNDIIRFLYYNYNNIINFCISIFIFKALVKSRFIANSVKVTMLNINLI